MMSVKDESGSRRERIEGILGSMQVKLKEIDALRKDLAREQSTGLSPKRSLEMLEEIKVPSIEVLRDDKRRR